MKNKMQLYLKLSTKTPKQTKWDEKQSSKQELDKVQTKRTKYKSKGKFKSKNAKCKTQVQKHIPWGTKNRQERAHKREHGHRQRLTNTMTRQGVKGTHRLNTQTLMNRRGTGEEREERGGQVW